MTDSNKRSRNSSLRNKQQGIKPTVIEMTDNGRSRADSGTVERIMRNLLLRLILKLRDIIHFPISGLAVTATKLTTHREQIKKVIQVTFRGTRFIKPETVRIIQSQLRITPSQATKTYDSAIGSS